MNILSYFLLAVSLISLSKAADAPSAAAIAAQLSMLQHNGNTYVKLRLVVKDAAGGAKTKVDLQIKSRRTAEASDVLYQVLWPKECKGEAVMVRKPAGQAGKVSVLTLPNTVSAPTLTQSVFESDLCYADLVENSFAWEQQAIVGNEVIDGIPCSIIESKPGKSVHSVYGSVKAWVDTKRMLPLRVEKYSSTGVLVRRVDTMRVTRDDDGQQVAATLLVRRVGGVTTTELEGTKIRRGVVYAERDFSVDGMKDVTVPHASE